MCTIRLNLRVAERADSCRRASVLAAVLALSASSGASALSTDRDQDLNVWAKTQKTAPATAGGPMFTVLSGNVRMEQGSLKANGDQARVYDLSQPGSDTTVRRLVLTGVPAHLEQRLDDGGRMSAQAATIDYNDGTGIAELTGNVVVIQQGQSEFRGPRMIYNTNTGAMEGGAEGGSEQIQLIFKPRPKPPAKPSSGGS